MSEISGKVSQTPVVLRLFGVFELEIEGRPVAQELPRKDRWLFALLALAGERPVQRAWRAQTLWPISETLESQAAAYLRKSLWNLRNTLGDHCFGDWVRSAASGEWCLLSAGIVAGWRDYVKT